MNLETEEREILELRLEQWRLNAKKAVREDDPQTFTDTFMIMVAIEKLLEEENR